MSLIHWWPLNGNLKDYGVNDKALTSASSSDNANGKIGKCRSFSGGGYCTISETTSSAVGSLALWIKPNSFPNDSSWQCLIVNASQSGYANSLFGIYFEYSQYLAVCCRGNTDVLTYKHNWTAGQWHHVAATYDGSTVKLYVDGLKVAQKTVSSGNINSSNRITIGANGSLSGAYINGYINDARVYDHALSQKEVKEISKGLILHYDFEDEEIEGTTNLSTANWSAYTSYWTIQSQTANEITLVSQGTSHGVVALQNSSVKSQLTANTTITISGYLYKDGAPYKTAVTYPTSYNSWTNISRESRDDGYFRLTGKFGNLDSVWLFHVALFGSPVSGTICKIKNLQWEIKDHATPFVNGTRSNGLVYDSSGYGYNGTQSGNVEIVSDSACGEHSAFFKGVSKLELTKLPVSKTGFSISIWAKDTGEYASDWWAGLLEIGNGLWINFGPNGGYAIQFGIFDGTHIWQATCANTANVWNHWVGTFDGTTSKLYKNGILVASANSGGYSCDLSSFSMSYIGGGRNNFSHAKLSDFKIYATALSADDILSEYKRKASIDRNGNLFTGEFVAENGKTNISKTGVVESSHFVEGLDKTKIHGNYIELEYIESSGTQYINADLTLENNFEIVIDQMNNFDTNNHYMVGSSTGGKMLGTLGNVIWCNGVVYSTVVFNRNTRETLGIKIVSDGSSYSDFECINYTTHARYSGRSAYYVRGGSNVLVFNVNGHTGAESFRLFSCKLFKDNILVRDFIPAKHKSDNVIGLFDLVNQKFYTNAGTGTFTAGPEKGELSIICMNELKEL